ncbi:nucleotide-diphospho-sugar transferase [Formosa sp. 4Alg 33]|uniref:nucleotide-diphospho-sugar transferase n=1 Tax=Formosa sp. 4Alg 33 TaxID=3382189 RepID=UPI003D9C083A
MLDTPILLLVFNRPEVTKASFESVKAAKPKYLFIAADGPRSEKSNEVELCAKTRETILNEIDWDCEVKTLFRTENLGCRKAVEEAIDWFFESVEYGIILEDDCLADASFYPFCQDLLEKYRTDDRVGMISGNNFGFNLFDPELSYSFSKHGLIWGWATWKRAWTKYRMVEQEFNEELGNVVLSNISNNPAFIKKWWNNAKFDLTDQTLIWDFIWGVTRYTNNYLVIRPKYNMVANIGFGEGATHTKSPVKEVFLQTKAINLPLQHPKFVVADTVSDKELEKFIIGDAPAPKQIKKSIFKVYKTKLHYLYLKLKQ